MSVEVMTCELRKRDDADLRLLFIGSSVQDEPAVLRTILHFRDPLEFPDPELAAREPSDGDSQCGRHQRYAKVAVAQVSRLGEHLSLRMLRRMRSEVLSDLIPGKKVVTVACGMTDMQRQLYIDVLKKNRMYLTLPVEVMRSSLPIVLLELKMVCNHPYLFPGNTPKLLGAREAHEALVASSGKLQFLEKMLPLLKAGGHNVLLLSQMRMMLGILLKFLAYLGLQYCLCSINHVPAAGIDIGCDWLHAGLMNIPLTPSGRSILTHSTQNIAAYLLLSSLPNSGAWESIWWLIPPDLLLWLPPLSNNDSLRRLSKIFPWGLEIPIDLIQENDNLRHLAFAVLHDPDYYSLVDILARVRAHRLAQHKSVLVYHLVTKCSVEEKILRGARKKLTFEDLMMRTSTTETAVDIKRLLLHAASIIFEFEDCNRAETFSDEKLRYLLDLRSTLTENGEHMHRQMTIRPENRTIQKDRDSQGAVPNAGIISSISKTSNTGGGLDGSKDQGCMISEGLLQSDFPCRKDIDLLSSCQNFLFAASSEGKVDLNTGAASTDLSTLSTDLGLTGGHPALGWTEAEACSWPISAFTNLDWEVGTAEEARLSPQSEVRHSSSPSMTTAKILDTSSVILDFCVDDDGSRESGPLKRKESSAVDDVATAKVVDTFSVIPGPSIDRAGPSDFDPLKRNKTSAAKKASAIIERSKGFLSAKRIPRAKRTSDAAAAVTEPAKLFLNSKNTFAAAATERAKVFPSGCPANHGSQEHVSSHRPAKKLARKVHTSRASSLEPLQPSRVESRENAADDEHPTCLRLSTTGSGGQSSTDQCTSAQVMLGGHMQQACASSTAQERSNQATGSPDMVLKASGTRKPLWLPKGDAGLLMGHLHEPGKSAMPLWLTRGLLREESSAAAEDGPSFSPAPSKSN